MTVRAATTAAASAASLYDHPLLYVALTVVIVYLLYTTVYLRYVHPTFYHTISTITHGPRGKPLLGNALDFVPARMHEWSISVTRNAQYCKDTTNNWLFYILSTPMIVVNNPYDLYYILGSHQKLFGKSDVYPMMLDWCSTGTLLQTNGKVWESQRKVLNEPFNSQNVKQMYSIVQQKAEQLVQRMDTLLENDKDSVVDVSPLVACYTQDIIGLAGFSHNFNSLGGDMRFRHAAEAILRECWHRIARVVPWQQQQMQKEGKEGLQLILAAIEKVIAEREHNELKPTDNDILAYMMRAAMTHDPATKQPLFPYPGYDLHSQYVNQTLLFMVAGADTTSSGLNSALYFLAKHHDVQKDLRAELQELSKTDNVDEHIQQLLDLPLLSAVVKETLRLRPSASTCGRKILVGSEPVTLPSGLTLTDAMNLDCAILQVQTSKELWGDDAAEFRPRRWLKPNNQVNPRPHKADYPLTHVYMPFLHGSRACIGQSLARIEMVAALYTIITKYEIDLVKEPAFECAISMAYVDGLYIRAKQLT